ncbi:PREDICTED: paired amphipathic helix protein Sin3-like 2 isoform X2 [Tarenaya hassleriana]|uniref:paired amphipathic helix protein Sin3-like 2 isoform X2 n=1 Tax=Tarenaya hassleriana TaxID=28532 RepID=UPI00053C8F05|nr:PREDICTED: paired amphipathic helix protein Sin3-like 2 isoform X2 [Tarenaya hassleriana]
MKRTGDDVFPVSQFKRPFGSSRGEAYEQTPASGGAHGVVGPRVAGDGGVGGEAVAFASQKLTTNDALGYLKEVKEIFQDQREKYETFLEVMKDFKAQRTDTAGVIGRVKELFKEHKNLIYGFNTFLPKGYEITIEEDDAPPKKSVEFEEAISLVNKIKKRFQTEEHVYKSFLDILNMYRRQHKDIHEVHREVSTLFLGHPDLLEEFMRFLPDVSATSQQAPFGCKRLQRYYEQSCGASVQRQVRAEKQHRYDQTVVGDRDATGSDFPDYDDNKGVMKMDKEYRRRVENQNRNGRNHGQDDMEIEQDNDRDSSLLHFPEKRKLEKKMEGFGTYSGHIPFDEKGIYDQACSFCEKVKERLCSQEDYQAFLKCLDIFSTGIIKRNDLQNLVTDLLGEYPDLMDEFNQFLKQCENIDGFLSSVISGKSLCVGGHINRVTKMGGGEREDDHDIEVAKEKERCKEKYWAKSIQELDLADCERCTPSYRLLPQDYPIPAASHRSELGIEVLNDHWVSVTSGSEDYSFKHMRRNQFEESLFRCEDDRFELDILLENVNYTAKRGEALLKCIIENNMDRPIRIEDYFTAINLRCIERLYGDHGLDVLEVLYRNPALVLPVILTRLKQKQEEWSKCREEFNKVWAEVYAKNHYKSLDHRSFYFKQQDPKNLSMKALVAEIEELKKKMRKESSFPLVIDASHRHPMVPHLKYEFGDASIHEDLHKLLQFSCEEICSKEQISKIMGLWNKFLETFLGVSPRSIGAEAVEDVGERKQAETVNNEPVPAYSIGKPVTVMSELTSRQLKVAETRDENVLPLVPGLGGSSLINEVCGAEESHGKADHTGKDDPTGSSDNVDKEVAGVEETEKRHDGSEQVEGGEIVAISVQSLGDQAGKGSEGNDPRNKEASAEDHLPEHNAIPSFQDGEAKTPAVLPGGVVLSDSCDTHHGKSSKLPEIEKEEGELSPDVDMEEDNFVIPVPSQHQSSSCEEQKSHEVQGDKDAHNEGSEDACKVGHVSSSLHGDCLRDECGAGEGEQSNLDDNAETDEKADRLTSTSPAPTCLEYVSLSLKPLAKHVPTTEERRDLRIFFGNDDFYVLFRLHQTLYERILAAKTNSTAADVKWRNCKDSSPLDRYTRFMSALCSLLDGSADNARFEDECRAIIGNHSYVLFTLDKLIFKLVKQLQMTATEETDKKLLQQYEYENSHNPRTRTDSVYYENARVLLQEENMYLFECSSSPHELTIHLMDSVAETPEPKGLSNKPYIADDLHNKGLSASPNGKEAEVTALPRSSSS